MSKRKPIGIYFSEKALQILKDNKEYGENRTQTVNRLLESCSIPAVSKVNVKLDDMARPVLFRFMEFFQTVKFSKVQSDKFQAMFSEIELNYISDMFAELK